MLLQIPPGIYSAERRLSVLVLYHISHLQLVHLVGTARERSIRGKVVAAVTIMVAFAPAALHLRAIELLAQAGRVFQDLERGEFRLDLAIENILAASLELLRFLLRHGPKGQIVQPLFGFAYLGVEVLPLPWQE